MEQVLTWGNTIKEMGVSGILAVLVVVMGYIIWMMALFIRSLLTKNDDCQKQLLDMATRDG